MSTASPGTDRIEGTVLDHVAHAVPRWQDAWGRYATDLGAEWNSGGPGTGFAPAQLRFANDARVEVLMPWDVEENDFLARFLATSGPGPHHLTFKVPDLARAVQQTRAFGIDPIGISYEDPEWFEAFLHPKVATGVVVQLAQQQNAWRSPPPDDYPTERRRRAAGPGTVPPAALDRRLPRGGRPRRRARAVHRPARRPPGRRGRTRRPVLGRCRLARSARAAARSDRRATAPTVRSAGPSDDDPAMSTTSGSPSRSPRACPTPSLPAHPSPSSTDHRRPPAPSRSPRPTTSGSGSSCCRPRPMPLPIRVPRAGSLLPMSEPTDPTDPAEGDSAPPRKSLLERLFTPQPVVPPKPTTDRRGNPTKWSIDRLDGRERVYSYVASVLAVVFAVIVFVEEHHHKVQPHAKNQLSPQTTLLLGLASGVALAVTTRIGRRALVGFVALFAFLSFGTFSTVVGLPFLILAVWLLYRSYKVQKEATAKLKEDRAAGRTEPVARQSRADAAATRRAERSGKKAPPGPEANKRYTPKKPPRPAPPPPKPSWRERRAARASD